MGQRMMLEELGKRPTVIGGLTIMFLDWRISYCLLSRCIDNVIYLANNTKSKLYILKDGMKFLLREWVEPPEIDGCECSLEYIPPEGGYRTFFGGWDRTTPFLYELCEEALSVYEQDGEEIFFKTLIPKCLVVVASVYYNKTGMQPIIRRQGSIYYVPYAGNWDWLDLKFRKPYQFKGQVKQVKEVLVPYPLVLTNHWLTSGTYLDETLNIGGFGPFTVVQGIIECDGHKPVDLSDQLYAVARANMYVSDRRKCNPML